MLGRPRWPTFILTSGTSINKDFTTCFRHFSSNLLLGPIPVAIYSPGSILHMVVEHRNPAIALWSNASKKLSPSMRKGLHTLSWMPSTSARRHPPSHHREKRSSTLWKNSSAFGFQISTYVLRVDLSSTF